MSKFTDIECKKIISYSESFIKRNVSDLVQHDNISYNWYLVTRNEDTQWVFDKFKEKVNEKYPNNKLDQKEHFNLHHYNVGNEFTVHIDSHRNPDQALVAGSILNNEFEGGEFIYYDPYEVYSEEKGNIYYFSTERPHEVTEITKGERWAMLMFITPEELGIKETLI